MNYPSTQLFVDNQWRDAADGRSLPIVNPANGKEIGRVARAAITDLDSALLAARRGFKVWRDMPAIERGRLMRRAAAVLRERVEGIATAMTLEQGKPLSEAKGEVISAADIIEWFADEGLRAYGRVVPARQLGVRQMVLKEPVGPVAAFTPWNFPITQPARKIAVALAAGCSIILKAPEETPAAPAALVQAFKDAGIPAGVIGLVYGDPAEISDYLIRNPVIRKISFTGSTSIGKQLAGLAGQHMKRVTMELGGHAPVIIAEDADLDLAVKTIGGLKFMNAGQVCVSPSRFLVHESLYGEFVARLSEHANQLKVGDGLVEKIQMGPLANPRRVAAMEELVEDAVHLGAKVSAGGSRLSESGNFWAPTVLSDVPLTAKVFNQEPFGPIAAVRSFSTLDEAVDEANRLPYGLACYAFTRSLKSAHILSQRIEAGMLWINQSAAPWPELPFGGLKDSGYGSDGGPEALDAYFCSRLVSVANV